MFSLDIRGCSNEIEFAQLKLDRWNLYKQNNSQKNQEAKLQTGFFLKAILLVRF
jgi:hypothetical protein